MKQIYFNKEAQEKVLKGLDIAIEAVGGTLGPKGKNVFLDTAYGHKVTNDGKTIAMSIVLDDPTEDKGAYLVRNTTSQTDDDCGDGTTTTAVLLGSLIHECLNRPENPMEIKESLKEASKKALKLLAKQSVKITKGDVEKVAFISAENKELAQAIHALIQKLGEKGVIDVIDSQNGTIETEIADGYEAPVGFMSELFINDEKTQSATHLDIPVLVTEKKITNAIDVVGIFKALQAAGHKSCAIVCDDISDDMLGAFVLTYRNRKMDLVVIRALGDKLKDIEASVGATAISDANGLSFQNVQLEHLGKAKKLVVDKNKSVFIGNGALAKVRAAELDKQADREPNQFIRAMITSRADRLRGSVGILKIGASTDFEQQYLKDKAIDAVKATQAALAEGVVEGGGMALWRVAKDMNGKTAGEQILKKVLKAPLKKIIENAGKDFDDMDFSDGSGYDAKNDKYCNLISMGIIDPHMVERRALTNAVSAAGEFSTVFCSISNKDEKTNK